MKPSGKILTDHKVIGKKLVPPLLQIGSMQLTSWVDTGLPETSWLAVLSDTLGHAAGVATALQLCKTAVNTQPATYAFVSDFEALSPEIWTSVREGLTPGTLSQLRQGLGTFLRIFPDCPFRALFDEPPSDVKPSDLAWFKPLLAALFAKGKRPATLALATVVYLEMGQGRLLVHPGSALLNLPAIEQYPETEASRHVASVVRATVNSFAGRNPTPVWPRYFWTRSFQLEPCTFADDEY